VNPPSASRPAYRPAADSRRMLGPLTPTGSVAADLGGRPKAKVRANAPGEVRAGGEAAADTIGPSGVLLIIRIISKNEILFNVWF